MNDYLKMSFYLLAGLWAGRVSGNCNLLTRHVRHWVGQFRKADKARKSFSPCLFDGHCWVFHNPPYFIIFSPFFKPAGTL